MIAVKVGTSPYPRNTQTGLNTGSTIEIIEASTAKILFNPEAKNAYATAI
jgi:hypothetical protein